MSNADLDVLQATLSHIDEDLDYDDRVARYQSQGESVSAIDVRRPQTPSPGVKGSDIVEDPVCFRTLQGQSCDPKKCIFSHEPVKLRKYLIDTLARHDAKHRHSLKAIAAEDSELEPGTPLRKPEAITEEDQEEEK